MQEGTGMTDNIEVFRHNSIGIRSSLGMIYADPFKMTAEPGDAAFILITHDHYDHFSPDDIAKAAGKDTVLVVPEKMEKKAGGVKDLVAAIVTVKPGESRVINGLELETVASYNIMKPFHPKSAGWVGYILNLDGKRIYIAGDTDATKEAAEVKCDIAIVPIGGTYTMDAKKAAELINTMQPEVAIPVHYGDIVGKPSDGEEFAKYVKDPVRVELKIRL